MEQPGTFAQQVARTVQDNMRASGLSARDVSAATGIPLTTLSRRLRGSPFTITELTLIGAALDRTVSDLVTVDAPA